MKIKLDQVGKRYQQHWIFKNLSAVFESGHLYAILGPNGSGKSTLLRIIAAMQHANKGQLQYSRNNNKLHPDQLYQYLSYCAPGMDLVEELSLKELLHFHFTFKKIRSAWNIDTILHALDMFPIRHQQIHEFSSGMKQRVKLAQAFFSDTPLLLLDEPCSNLDQEGVQLYQQWLNELTADRLVLIASNDSREYPGVQESIQISAYQQ